MGDDYKTIVADPRALPFLRILHQDSAANSDGFYQVGVQGQPDLKFSVNIDAYSAVKQLIADAENSPEKIDQASEGVRLLEGKRLHHNANFVIAVLQMESPAEFAKFLSEVIQEVGAIEKAIDLYHQGVSPILEMLSENGLLTPETRSFIVGTQLNYDSVVRFIENLDHLGVLTVNNLLLLDEPDMRQDKCDDYCDKLDVLCECMEINDTDEGGRLCRELSAHGFDVSVVLSQLIKGVTLEASKCFIAISAICLTVKADHIRDAAKYGDVLPSDKLLEDKLAVVAGVFTAGLLVKTVFHMAQACAPDAVSESKSKLSRFWGSVSGASSDKSGGQVDTPQKRY